MRPEHGPNKHKHLEMIQGAINRLASNSFSIKQWTVMLVSAIFVLVARDGKVPVWVALVPVMAFWGLDGYFLRQERRFRNLYVDVSETDESEITFSMEGRTQGHVVLEGGLLGYPAFVLRAVHRTCSLHLIVLLAADPPHDVLPQSLLMGPAPPRCVFRNAQAGRSAAAEQSPNRKDHATMNPWLGSRDIQRALREMLVSIDGEHHATGQSVLQVPGDHPQTRARVSWHPAWPAPAGLFLQRPHRACAGERNRRDAGIPCRNGRSDRARSGS